MELKVVIVDLLTMQPDYPFKIFLDKSDNYISLVQALAADISI